MADNQDILKNVKFVNKGNNYNPKRKENEKSVYLYNKLNDTKKDDELPHKLTKNAKESSELVFKIVEETIKNIPNQKFHLALTYTTKHGRFSKYLPINITKFNGINDIKKIFQDYDEYLRSKMQQTDNGIYDLAITIIYK